VQGHSDFDKLLEEKMFCSFYDGKSNPKISVGKKAAFDT
jgi:hypothetical protein